MGLYFFFNNVCSSAEGWLHYILEPYCSTFSHCEHHYSSRENLIRFFCSVIWGRYCCQNYIRSQNYIREPALFLINNHNTDMLKTTENVLLMEYKLVQGIFVSVYLSLIFLLTIVCSQSGYLGTSQCIILNRFGQNVITPTLCYNVLPSGLC